MPVLIAVISDIHDSARKPAISSRKGQWGRIFLQKLVHRLNRFIKPDLVLLLGDLIDDPAASDALERLQALRAVLDKLNMPWLAMPGNHDPQPDQFYRVMPDRGPSVDVAGVRVVRFLDLEAPGYNATRSSIDVERVRSIRRDGFAGPVIAMQHVPLLPAGSTESCFGYTNVDEIVQACEEAAVTLSIAGHFHPGTPLVRLARSAYLTVPALTEDPFQYSLIQIDGDRIEVRNEALKMPAELGLCDFHSHTQFAYCSEDMNALVSPELAQLLGIRTQALTEHSGQLYFKPEVYWAGQYGPEGVAGEHGAQNRMAAYWQAAQESAARFEHVVVGFEVDSDFAGRQVLRAEDAQRAQVLTGAVHHLPEARAPQPDAARLADQFMAVLEPFTRSGIGILAHPFRIFLKSNAQPPRWLFERTVELLREHDVAAEINFHGNEPEPEFFKLAIESGVKITFGSDAHALWEIGEFYPHLRLLEQLGVGPSELAEVLAQPVRYAGR